MSKATELPDTFTCNMHIYYNNYTEDLVLSPYDISSAGFTFLGEEEVTVKVPKVNIVEMKIVSLNKAKQACMAEAQQKIQQFDDQIASLQCLEHK